jgi:hypothetical protein
MVLSVIAFGALAAPILEVKLGMGGERPRRRRGSECGQRDGRA